MASEVATAYVSLVVDGSKIAPDIRAAFKKAGPEASRAGKDAGREFGQGVTKEAKSTATELGQAGKRGGQAFGDAAGREAGQSFEGFGSRIKSGASSMMSRVGRSSGEAFGDAAGDEASESFIDKARSGISAKAAVLGVAAGAAAASGLSQAFERESAGAQLQASLGLSPARSKALGEVAGRLYAGAWGDSFSDVSNAVGTVTTSIRGMRNAGVADIERLTIKALDFAGTFDGDINRAVQVAGTVINSGLAKNGDRAFDLLFAASQRVPTQLREDLQDAAEEYGQFAKSLGMSGKDFFNVLVAGADQGIYGIDKAGDAIKEFTIRATDMSKTSQEAYSSIGLDARQMANDILAGGDRAQGATRKIINGLLGIKDPADRANAAIALFGTPIEDLNVNKIPAFLRSLRGTENRLGNVDGAAERAGDALNDTSRVKFTELKRSIEKDLVDILANDVLPAAKKVTGALNDMPGWAVKGTLGGFLGLLAAGKIAGAVGNLRGALTAPGIPGSPGGLLKGGVQKVFVVNMAPGVGGTPGGPGGKPGGRTPPVVVPTGNLSKLKNFATSAAKGLGGVAAAYFGIKTAQDRWEQAGPLEPWQRLKPLLPAVRSEFGHVKATYGDLKVAVDRLDGSMVRNIKRNPADGYRDFRRAAAQADMSVTDLAKVLPRASKAIEQSGAKSKWSAERTNVWRKTVGEARQEVNKVDGKKPKVTWNNPGLLKGIVDSKRLDGNIRTVDGKKPKAHFSLPGIGSRISEAQRLNSALDQAARDRSSTITITRRVIGGARDLAGLPFGGARAAGGPVQPNRAYRVGELGPEMFVPDRAGTIVPNHEVGRVGGFTRRDVEFIARALAEAAYNGTSGVREAQGMRRRAR